MRRAQENFGDHDEFVEGSKMTLRDYVDEAVRGANIDPHLAGIVEEVAWDAKVSQYSVRSILYKEFEFSYGSKAICLHLEIDSKTERLVKPAWTFVHEVKGRERFVQETAVLYLAVKAILQTEADTLQNPLAYKFGPTTDSMHEFEALRDIFQWEVADSFSEGPHGANLLEEGGMRNGINTTFSLPSGRINSSSIFRNMGLKLLWSCKFHDRRYALGFAVLVLFVATLDLG